jgi:uncharacterized membrane protein HdeD (DUF308 family)
MPAPALHLGQVAKHWWVLALRGAAAIVFALLAFFWPGLTLLALAVTWGVFALIEGITSIIVGFRGKWWAMVGLGVVGVLAGIVALIWPSITALALLFLIAAWAIVRGIAEIVAAIQLRKEIEGEWMLILSGIASVAFGVLLLLFPGAGAVSVVWLIATFALIFGVLSIILAFKVKSVKDHVHDAAAARQSAATEPGAPERRPIS